MPVWMALSMCASFLVVDVPDTRQPGITEVPAQPAIQQLAQQQTNEPRDPGTPVAAFWFVDAR